MYHQSFEMLVQPGDNVLVESPTYAGALASVSLSAAFSLLYTMYKHSTEHLVEYNFAQDATETHQIDKYENGDNIHFKTFFLVLNC